MEQQPQRRPVGIWIALSIGLCVLAAPVGGRAETAGDAAVLPTPPADDPLSTLLHRTERQITAGHGLVPLNDSALDTWQQVIAVAFPVTPSTVQAMTGFAATARTRADAEARLGRGEVSSAFDLFARLAENYVLRAQVVAVDPALRAQSAPGRPPMPATATLATAMATARALRDAELNEMKPTASDPPAVAAAQAPVPSDSPAPTPSDTQAPPQIAARTPEPVDAQPPVRVATQTPAPTDTPAPVTQDPPAPAPVSGVMRMADATPAARLSAAPTPAPGRTETVARVDAPLPLMREAAPLVGAAAPTDAQASAVTSTPLLLATASPPVAAPTATVMVVPTGATLRDPSVAALYLGRGDDMLAIKDITAARRFYEFAANAGNARAAASLARTYDPDSLREMGAVGLKPDPALAARWYSRARELGDPDSATHVNQVRMQAAQ